MNTKVLIRTLSNPQGFEVDLKEKGFIYQAAGDKIEVEVGYKEVQDFSEVIKEFLNAKYNYANIKFPDRKLNILVFPERTFVVDDANSDAVAKEWAIAAGLSLEETEWTTFY